MEAKKKKELIMTLKYIGFTCSAGVIQFCSTLILSSIWTAEKFANGPVLFYLIGLILSVIWNLTFNRKFTFKSAASFPIAMLKTLAFYIVFTPASCLLQGWLTNGVLVENSTLTINSYLGLPVLAGTAICMVVNFLLEFPFQRFVVFRNSIDTSNKKTNKQS
ncbi:MAG: GtrA family protein [Bacilli bacterium]|nr:GtrA family protein [Bacilli bacterium]